LETTHGGEFFETNFDTNSDYSTLYTQRNNGIEVMTGSIQVNEATKPGAKAIVPPLDYHNFPGRQEQKSVGTHPVVQKINTVDTTKYQAASTPVRTQNQAPTFNFNHPK
jgi:hypothetical protein